PADVRTLLSSIRKELNDEKSSFSVGYTPALDRKLPDTSMSNSVDTAARTKQNEIAQTTLSKANIPTIESLRTASTRCSDRRSLAYSGSDVSGIRDQGACGSCWAFAGAGILESSYRIRYGRAANVAEQELLDCALGPFNGAVDGCQGLFPESSL